MLMRQIPFHLSYTLLYVFIMAAHSFVLLLFPWGLRSCRFRIGILYVYCRYPTQSFAFGCSSKVQDFYPVPNIN